jgi:F0F1-type ATP synthase membrane subunit b/b'
MVKKLMAAGLMLGFMMSMTMMTATPAIAKERHPKIRQAIKALENAKADLNAAAHDFGGHRVDALAAVDKAIEQLNLCLQFDKN